MAAKVGALIIDLRASTTKFAHDMNQAARKMRRFGGRMQAMGREMTMGMTAPLLGIGGASMKLAATFNKSMSKIEGLVGVSSDQVKAWKKDIDKLAPATGKGPDELARAMFFITSAGIKGSKALDVLEESAKASAGGLGETAGVADAVTSAMNAYGPGVLDAKKATGILVAAVREGKLAAEELAPALGKILPMASSLGVPFDQVAAAVAAMSRSGLNAAESTTSLRGILSAIMKPSDGAAKTLAKYGTSVDEVRKSLRENGLLATLQSLKDRFGDNQEAMAKVFPDIQGLSGVMNILGGDGEATREIFAKLAKEVGGATEKAFGAASKTDDFKLAQNAAAMAVAFTKLGEAIGPVVIPAIEKLTELITTLSGLFTSMSPDMQEMAVTIAGVLAVTGPILLAVGTFVKIFGGTFGSGGTLLKILATFGRVLKFMVMKMGPIGWFISAATLAVAAYKNWDKISAIAKDVYTAIKTWLLDKFSAVVESIGVAVDKITGFFAGMYDAVVGHSYVPDMIDGIGEHFGRLDTVMVDPALEATDETQKAFDALGRGINDFVRDGEFSLKSFARTAISVFQQIMQQQSGLSGSGGGGLGGLLSLGFNSLLNSGGGSLSSTVNTPVATFAHGGGGRVGGSGGTDSQLVAFRASPNERVSVTTPHQQGRGGGGGVTINQSFDFRGAGPGVMAEVHRAMVQVKTETFEAVFAAMGDGGRASVAVGRRG